VVHGVAGILGDHPHDQVTITLFKRVFHRTICA
jgi:hypothetical protein